MNDASVAFLSYVRFDDEHDNGRLTQFRERLSREVRIQTGQSFEIFQDRKDIAWGEQWLPRIEGTLQSVTFFIPVITPTFFASVACRDELALFLEHEARLRRSDLILPVYYVECARLSDKEQRAEDPLAQALAERQFFDWRAYRFEPFTTPAVGKSFESMARQIRDALGRAPRSPRPNESPRGSVAGSGPPSWTERLKQSALQATGLASRGASSEGQAPVLIVDALHRGHYPTIGQAIHAAKPGSRIMVRPGLYREGVVIDKPLELIGEGDRADIVIEASGKAAILFQATMGRVANLTLRQAGGDPCFCVDVAQGRLDLEDCDLSSETLACVAIHDSADSRLRRNRIHDGKSCGVFFYEKGQGILEENEIFANALAGVEIKSGANPTLRRNRIHDGKTGGVLCHENGSGILEENEIFANAFSGVEIKSGANPTLRRNRIHDGKSCGVMCHENGQGILEENEIFSNAFAGVDIDSGANPTLRRNRLFKNKSAAVVVRQAGGGTFVENDLRGSTKTWEIHPASNSTVIRKDNIESSGS